MTPTFTVRWLGQVDYRTTLRAMQTQVAERGPQEPDELWVLEHEPVYTLGLRGNRQYLHDVPEHLVVASDRGGEVTWHGPGQLVVYVLLDLKRRGLGVKGLVTQLEQALITVLCAAGIPAEREPGAPGVYVDGAKIASLGLRVSRGCSYHGLALNVDCDLHAFSTIDPCGMPGRRMTRTRDFGRLEPVAVWGERLVEALQQTLAVPEEAQVA